METPDRLSRWLPWIVLTLCLVFGLRFGFNYGVSNQNQYLLPAIQMLNSDLLTHDWFTVQTTSYHVVFPYLAYAMLAAVPSGWLFGIANFLTALAAGWLFFLIVRGLVSDELLVPVYIVVMTLVGLTLTDSAGGVYIVSGIFQPSTLGALGFLAGSYFFFTGRYFVSSLLLATGGLFHANYLVLTFPIFGLAHLLLGRERLLTRLLTQLGAPLAVLAVFLPEMLTVARAPEAELANHIYVDIRVPHHHDPRFFYKGFIPLIGWLLFGLSLGWRWLNDTAFIRRFKYLLYACLTSIVVGLFSTTIVFSYSVARLMPWRVSPFVELAMIVIGSIGLLKVMSRPASTHPIGSGRGLTALAGLGLVAAYHGYKGYYLLAGTLMVLGAVLVLWHWFGPRLNSSRGGLFRQTVVLSLIALIVYGTVLGSVPRRSRLISGLGVLDQQFYDWVKTTDMDALFTVPPGLEDFRVWGERAVVIDWKSMPSMPDEVVEWHRRHTLQSGTDQFGSLPDLESHYATMDRARLGLLRDEFGISYAVFRQGLKSELDSLEMVFENDKYLVIRVPGPLADSTQPTE